MTTRPPRRRADIDDEPEPPAFVTEPDKPFPKCVRCGRDRSHDRPPPRALLTVCPACEAKELGDLKKRFELTPHVPRHPQGTQGMIHELARDLAMTFPAARGDERPLPPSAVLQHAENFRKRGLSADRALWVAEGMVRESSHRAGCAICQANLTEIQEKLLKPSEEAERYARSGRHHLPRKFGGSGGTTGG